MEKTLNTANCYTCLCCMSRDNIIFIVTNEVQVGHSTKTLLEILKIFPLEQIPEEETHVCENCYKAILEFYKFYLKIRSSFELFEKLKSKHDEDLRLVQKEIFCEKSFENQMPIECEICKKKFKTKRGFEIHNLYQHENKDEGIECHYCRKKFKTRTNFTNHLRHHIDFICIYCDFGFINEESMIKHVDSMHKDLFYKCHICDKSIPMRKLLNRHLKTVHKVNEKNIFCGHCKDRAVKFVERGVFIQHLQECHSNPEANCDFLDQMFNWEAEFLDEYLNDPEIFKFNEKNKEKLKCSEIKPSQNEEAQENFLKNVDLVKNKTVKDNVLNPNKMILEEFLDEAFENDQIWNKYIEGGEEYLMDDYYLDDFESPNRNKGKTLKYKCPRCDRKFEKQFELTVHLAHDHDEMCLVCNDCGTAFNRKENYEKHRQEHQKENQKIRESNILEAEEALSLQSQNNLEYEMNEEENKFIFHCKLCGKKFQRRYNLEKHNCLFYKDKGRQLDCQDCPEKFKSTKELYLHQKTHAQDNLYCSLCDKKFTSISGLKYHLKRHNDLKAFTCPFCSKKCTANSNLNAHIRNMHSEKIIPCPHCDLKFASKDHLTKHQKLHNGIKSFVCEICSKGFYQKSHLTDHLNTHGTFKTFLCTICNHSYTTRGSLRRHLRTTHNRPINSNGNTIS